jgi:hypothetical protein
MIVLKLASRYERLPGDVSDDPGSVAPNCQNHRAFGRTDARYRTESEIVGRLCAGMQQELTFPDSTRLDCLSTTHAIEVDFSDNGLPDCPTITSSETIRCRSANQPRP